MESTLRNLSERAHALPKWLALAAMIAVGLAVASCTGAAPQRGWSGATLDGDRLYFGARDGRLVGIDTGDGSREWAVPLETGTTTTGLGCSRSQIVVSIYGTPVFSDGLIYVGGYNGRVYSFVPGESQPDRVLQRIRVDDRDVAIGPIVGGVALDDGRLFFGSSDGNVYGVTDRLQPLWPEPFRTGGKIWSTPAVVGDTVYVGSFDNKLYALDAADGAEKWQFPTDGVIVATPVVGGGTVYAASFDRSLYAIDAATGQLKWQFEARRPFWASPLLYDGLIYAPSLDGKIHVLNASTGDKVAEVDLKSQVSSSPVIVGSDILVATEEGVLWIIDTSSHQSRELLKLGEKVSGPLAASGTSVFVHTDRDSLFGVEVSTAAMRKYEFK